MTDAKDKPLHLSKEFHSDLNGELSWLKTTFVKRSKEIMDTDQRIGYRRFFQLRSTIRPYSAA